MNTGLSDKIRALAQSKYVYPAVLAGKRPLLDPGKGFTERPTRGRISRRPYAPGLYGFANVEIPPREWAGNRRGRRAALENEPYGGGSISCGKAVARLEAAKGRKENGALESPEQDPAARALRMTEKLRGILKEELAEYGGGEAFLRWVRSENENAA